MEGWGGGGVVTEDDKGWGGASSLENINCRKK